MTPAGTLVTEMTRRPRRDPDYGWGWGGPVLSWGEPRLWQGCCRILRGRDRLRSRKSLVYLAAMSTSLWLWVKRTTDVSVCVGGVVMRAEH